MLALVISGLFSMCNVVKLLFDAVPLKLIRALHEATLNVVRFGVRTLEVNVANAELLMDKEVNPVIEPLNTTDDIETLLFAVIVANEVDEPLTVNDVNTGLLLAVNEVKPDNVLQSALVRDVLLTVNEVNAVSLVTSK